MRGQSLPPLTVPLEQHVLPCRSPGVGECRGGQQYSRLQTSLWTGTSRTPAFHICGGREKEVRSSHGQSAALPLLRSCCVVVPRHQGAPSCPSDFSIKKLLLLNAAGRGTVDGGGGTSVDVIYRYRPTGAWLWAQANRGVAEPATAAAGQLASEGFSSRVGRGSHPGKT